MNGIKHAAQKAGSNNKLAEMLGIQRQVVDYWVRTGRPSPKFCVKISDLTGVPLHDLRPDVFPPETQNKAP